MIMDVMTAIKLRRSIRSYSDEPIEEEKLEAILESARLSPSAGNRQDRKFIVVTDKAIREKLVDAAHGQQFVGQAPVVIVACATQAGYIMPCEVLAYPVDVAIAVDHITLAAVEQGLGTCWIGAFKQDDVKKLLGIPDNVRVVALLPIGYPSEVPDPRPRKNLDDIISYEKW
jgi:nitroreductase